MLILSILLACFQMSFAFAQAPDPPKGIHLTWRTNDTSHTIVVTWKTVTAEAGDKVLYDTEPKGGDPALYRYSTVGEHHTYVDAGGYIHDVELTGLEPDTTYYFICGGEVGGWSSERSFRTAPSSRKSFRFIVGADSRRSGPYDADELDIPPFPEMRNKVSQAMAKFNPSFVIFIGDLIRDAFDQEQWDNWFEMVETYWIDNFGRTIPIIPVIGNHEVVWPQLEYSKDDARNYYGQFCLPGNERWYSLDWGPDLHITVLNSEIPRDQYSEEEFDWLWSDLAANRDKKWKIAAFHRPPFSGGHSKWEIQNAWVQKAFDLFHVDLVMNGHVHNYERTGPINLLKSEEELQASPEDGTIYIITGGWGAPLTAGRKEWFTAYGPEYKYHFVVVDVFENGTLRLRAVDENGSVFDEFSITKPVEAPAELWISTSSLGVIVAAVIVCIAVVVYLRRR
jgi:hypothetical protein